MLARGATHRVSAGTRWLRLSGVIAVTWAALGVLTAVSLGFMALVSTKIDALSTRIDAQSARIDDVVKGLGSLEGKVGELAGQVASLSVRVEHLEHHPV